MRFQLARIADWVASPSLEKALYTYRVAPASLERARQQGIPVARVLEFLGRETGAPVPRSIEAALTRWDARGTEELMEQVEASPSARRLIGERIGPKAVLVREQDWPRLAAALGEIGLLPEVIALEDIPPAKE